MNRRYAQGTTVAAEKSRMEVERFLQKRGAKSFATMNNDDLFAIQFQIERRTVRIVVPRATPHRTGNAEARRRQAEAENRRRWRALLLVLRAKFEAIGSGITTFDREFMAHLVTGSGQTVGDIVEADLDSRLLGDAPSFLALPPPRSS